MIEDLPGHMMRVVDGLAQEISERVAPDHTTLQREVFSHARQVLIDWFLGEFMPGEYPKRRPPPSESE